VEVEGLDTRRWKLAELRRAVALVSQEPYLFSDSILNNLALGELDADPAAAARWAEVADLHAFIQGLPEGYASMLGEKGVNLSGGQKQRLALARALYRRPRLLLLDDAFSAVDTATEERIVGKLRAALPGVSVLLVSHRSSTLRLCDRVAVMEGGRISDEGTHEQLLGRGGYYAEMVRRERLAASAGLGA
jgi:ATP-binding cassette subfamily B protein